MYFSIKNKDYGRYQPFSTQNPFKRLWLRLFGHRGCVVDMGKSDNDYTVELNCYVYRGVIYVDGMTVTKPEE
jgi:hypothetical protein